MHDEVTFRITFKATSPPFPEDFVQRREHGHPLVGDSPIRAEFASADEYVAAWESWRRRSAAYERDDRMSSEERKVATRIKLEMRYPDAILAFEEAGLI